MRAAAQSHLAVPGRRLGPRLRPVQHRLLGPGHLARAARPAAWAGWTCTGIPTAAGSPRSSPPGTRGSCARSRSTPPTRSSTSTRGTRPRPSTARRAFAQACSRSVACAAATRGPGAWARIGALAARLARSPVTGATVSTAGSRTRLTVTAQTLVNLVNNAGFDPVVYRDLDAAARALLRRDDAAPLLRLAALSLGYDDTNDTAAGVQRRPVLRRGLHRLRAALQPDRAARGPGPPVPRGAAPGAAARIRAVHHQPVDPDWTSTPRPTAAAWTGRRRHTWSRPSPAHRRWCRPRCRCSSSPAPSTR